MPELGKIQSTNFQSLLSELGITRNEIPFSLRSEVSPVVLVGGTVSFLASPTPAYRVVDVFTTGVQVAPPVNTVLADTGPLPIGSYSLEISFFHDEAIGTRAHFQVEWRNAANAANLVAQRVSTLGESIEVWNTRFDILNDDERFRVLNVVVGGVGISYQVSIFSRI